MMQTLGRPVISATKITGATFIVFKTPTLTSL